MHFPENVLLIVENRMSRLDLGKTLALTGRTVFLARSAEQAAKILNQDNTIRLVFAEAKIPGTIDGVELIDEIRLRWPSIRVEIAHTNLTKPVRLGELVSRWQSANCGSIRRTT